ncbi:MAG: serine/threonine-protein kinase [Casimicrobiaceae bacterium]
MPPDLLGRYEITGELGRGAMGVVYKARDPLIDRVVAIKTVGLDLSPEESDAFEQRFFREAKSAGRLNHPNIVTIHDVGRSNGSAYIAMEFLQGQSLREILDSGVVLPPERIAEIIAQVADGLAFAHENGVVHRDIKPPNIMVLDNGVVKITDFGIAMLPTGGRTLVGTVFGSPKYMSPERIAGHKVDGRSDIFSLGTVLYEMLTGFTPFFGGDLKTVFDQVINETPAAPSTRNKGIAPAFDYIVAKAMAKHPDDRYANAQAMAEDLRKFRELNPPIIAPAPARTLERRRVPRNTAGPAEIRDPYVAAAAPVPPPSSPTPSTDNAAIAKQRKRVAYGVFAALFVVVAVGVLLSTRHPDRPPPITIQADDKAPAETLADPKPSAPVLPSAAAEPVEHSAPTTPTAAPPTPEPTPVAVVPAPAIAKPMARLSLAVTPWGEVYVDGRKSGISPPLTELKLAPGKHTIEIRNTTFPPYSQTVNLDANATLKIRHKFQ